MPRLLKQLLGSVTASALAFAPAVSRANPLGGQVTAGSATIAGTGTSSLTINQSTPRAIVDWRSFNIAPTDTTQFIQPGSTAVTLNRVTGGLGTSQIDGTLKANGSVYIVNPDGILFGPSAKVNVGSLLATTHDIANQDFMAGRNNFTISGRPTASIVNQGSITAASGGFAALVAPGVRNDGIITASLGTVALASGNKFTLDLYGDSLIKLQPSDAIASNVRDVATGKTLTSLVQNTGTLRARGGTVSLTAVTAKKVVDSVINSSGVVEANTVGTRHGLVIFGAATAGTKLAGSPIQTVKVSGRISAAGRRVGASGGKIQVTGENIVLAKAHLDASGQTGGGKILVGGDFMGGNPAAPAVTQYGQSLEPYAVPTATTVSVDAASILNASAKATGNGGKVVVWSDDQTSITGAVFAKGGAQGGNGGFAEVSGKTTVNYTGMVANMSSPHGAPGTILVDPATDTIDTGKAATIADILNTGSNWSEPVTDQLVVAADILKTAGGDATLTFSANQSITLEDGITIGSSSGRLNVNIDLPSLLLDSGPSGCSTSSSCTGPEGLLYNLTLDLFQHNLLPGSSLNTTYTLSGFINSFFPNGALTIISPDNSTAIGLAQNGGFVFGPNSRIYTNGGTFSIPNDNNPHVILSTIGGCGSLSNCTDIGQTGSPSAIIDILLINNGANDYQTAGLVSSSPVTFLGYLPSSSGTGASGTGTQTGTVGSNGAAGGTSSTPGIDHSSNEQIPTAASGLDPDVLSAQIVAGIVPPASDQNAESPISIGPQYPGIVTDSSNNMPARSSTQLSDEEVARLNGSSPDSSIAQLEKDADLDLTVFGWAYEKITSGFGVKPVAKVLNANASSAIDSIKDSINPYDEGHDVHAYTITGQWLKDDWREGDAIQANLNRYLNQR